MGRKSHTWAPLSVYGKVRYWSPGSLYLILDRRLSCVLFFRQRSKSCTGGSPAAQPGRDYPLRSQSLTRRTRQGRRRWTRAESRSWLRGVSPLTTRYVESLRCLRRVLSMTTRSLAADYAESRRWLRGVSPLTTRSLAADHAESRRWVADYWLRGVSPLTTRSVTDDHAQSRRWPRGVSPLTTRSLAADHAESRRWVADYWLRGVSPLTTRILAADYAECYRWPRGVSPLTTRSLAADYAEFILYSWPSRGGCGSRLAVPASPLTNVKGEGEVLVGVSRIVRLGRCHRFRGWQKVAHRVRLWKVHAVDRSIITRI